VRVHHEAANGKFLGRRLTGTGEVRLKQEYE
jgi:hypothetical protein